MRRSFNLVYGGYASFGSKPLIRLDVLEDTAQVGDHDGVFAVEVFGRGRIRPVAVAGEVQRRHTHRARAGDVGAPRVTDEQARSRLDPELGQRVLEDAWVRLPCACPRR